MIQKKKENNSFAIKLKLSKDKAVTFEIIYHFTKGGMVQLAPGEKRVNIEHLNNLLENKKYWKEHEKMTLDAFKKIKKALAISVFLPVPLSGSFQDFLRMFTSAILKRRKINYKGLYQLHLLKNETYYYVIKNALELKTSKTYNSF